MSDFKRFILYAGLALITALGIRIGLQNYPFKYVRIFSTYQFLEQEELQKIIDERLSSGFFYLNLKKLTNDFLNNPWIYAASARRIWPNGLSITLLEQRPILIWQKQLVNSRGEFFIPDSSTNLELPEVIAEQENLKEAITIHEHLQAFNWPFQLTKIQYFAEHYWQLTFSPNFTLILKNKSPNQQLSHLFPILEKITEKFTKIPEYVDARYLNDLAVKW